jgi:ParB-like chromosome segregation protein Spo0J
MILKGHGRQIAARKCGLALVPTITRPGLTPAQKRAIVIADNQAPLLGGWDKDLLKLELGELRRLDYPLQLTGFSEASLVSYLAAGDPTPPSGFKAFGEDIAVEHQCPKCAYRWSGSSRPPEAAKK